MLCTSGVEIFAPPGQHLGSLQIEVGKHVLDLEQAD
eukprot:CAMPEP_0195260808 /NCGR_PEP_ID=MMETSP0706-20130129/8773_1 /TAXON_ID=33640 /ORGANISM="Asterionellopsis glacialis, Strain CCMP134" /LENGTH=35 /DNA_ID= /DNA_START= /DNA_END= /DNA_ORIENTATION=